MDISIQELLNEIKKRREKQGLFTRENYDELIDEVIDEHMSNGLITDDDDIEVLKSRLRSRWGDIINNK